MDMLMVCHHLNPSVPEDVAFAESRIRPETMAAEDVLHDLGVISMYSSDSQAMGRAGENFTRLFQTADKMRRMKGKLAEDSPHHDNFRVLRYLAKLTINPAIAHGISHVVGSITPGKLADIVLWPIGSFGAKPKMVVKGGMINWAVMGDPNGSIPTGEPTIYRPMFGAYGPASHRTCVTFLSRQACHQGVPEHLGLQRQIETVQACRSLTKRQMVRNDRLPVIEVDPETYQVRVDGEIATVPPADRLSLAQLHFLV
jgi:urease subunit alpha